MNKNRIFIQFTLQERFVKALIDSGAIRNIISKDYVKRFGVPLTRITEFYYMRTINKTNATQVQYQIKPLWIRSNNHKEKIIFDVIKTQRDIYLDILWLTKWNFKIEWTSMRIEIESHLLNISKRLIELKKNLNSFIRKWKIKKELTVTNEISQLLKRFQKVLKKLKEELLLSIHTQEDHKIILTNSEKLKTESIYELNDEESIILRKYIDHNLIKEYIRHFKFRTEQPILFTFKKSKELRLCIDFRKINALTQKDKYSLSLMTDFKIRINKAWWFIKFNLRDAFNLIRTKQENEWKTTFKTKYGLFEYLIMSFELINVSAILQRAVNKILYDYLDVFVIIYMNDILVFSETREKHEVHVTKIL